MKVVTMTRTVVGRSLTRDPVLPDDQGPVRSVAAPSHGMVESLLKLAGLSWKVPDYSSRPGKILQ